MTSKNKVLNDLSELSVDGTFEIGELSTPGYLYSITHNELLDKFIPENPAIVPGLVGSGVTILAGAPKLGKSFLVLELAYYLSTGQPLWGIPLQKCEVLYLALEDTEQRLQQRAYRMFGSEGSELLHFATNAKKMDHGLQEQLTYFLNKYPNTKLVIIDTMQSIRDGTPKGNLYAEDCNYMETIQEFRKEHCISILLVHHTRKMPDQNDRFNTIGGSNGNMGGADSIIVMTKENRTDQKAILECTGRDIPEQRFVIQRNPSTLIWDLAEMETADWSQPADPILEKIAQMLGPDNPELSVSPTELTNLLDLDWPPNRLSRHLNANTNFLWEKHHISYQRKTEHAGRKICLHYEK